MSQLTENFKERLLLTALIFNNVYIFIITNLFYTSTFGADYERYVNYLEYFITGRESTDLDQGSLYFYLVSIGIKLNSNFINPINLDTTISYSIQLVNFILVLITLFGFYKLLMLLNFDKIPILTVLNIIVFSPQLLALRLTMKPEIMVLSLLPYLLIGVEMYMRNNKSRYLVFSSICFALIISSKGTFLAIMPIFLFVYIGKFFNKLTLKEFTLSLFVVCITALPIFIENYNINDNSLISRSVSDKYNNTADFDILYRNVDGKKLGVGPYSFDNNTVVGIALTDIYDDYFNMYWNKDVSLFKKHRKEIFIESQSNKWIKFDLENRHIYYKGKLSKILIESRLWLSRLLGVIFYCLLFYCLFKDRKYKRMYVGPLIGMFILYINALGFPENNFDPFTADTFKVFYYSPFVILTTVFVLLYFYRYKWFKNVVIFTIISTVYICGFPKQDSVQYFSDLNQSNVANPLCELNRFVINDIPKNSDCHNPELEFCNLLVNPGIDSSNTSSFIIENKSCNLTEPRTPSNQGLARLPVLSMLYFLYVLIFTLRLRLNH
jgi:hypothetical protein